MNKTYYVYIMTNQRRTVLYIGVTSDIARRVTEHRSGTVSSFAKKYRTQLLVHLESFSSSQEAIAREKQLKGGSRKKKTELIESANPFWTDLSPML
jgi:putative endonuclease